MDDKIEVRILGTKAVLEGMRRRAKRVNGAVLEAMQRIVIGLESHVVTEKLSGQVLHRRSGVLSGAVHGVAGMGANGQVIGRVSVGKQAWYGKLHEYGGIFTVPAHTRKITHFFGHQFPKGQTARALAQVRTYVMKVPERSFMRSRCFSSRMTSSSVMLPVAQRERVAGATCHIRRTAPRS